MSIVYACVTLVIASGVASLCFWKLYQNAIKREICTSEVLCAVLLSPMLHSEFQDAAYKVITARYPSGEDYPSELEVALLQQELMAKLGDGSLLFSSTHGPGSTLRRILSGPNVYAQARGS